MVKQTRLICLLLLWLCTACAPQPMTSGDGIVRLTLFWTPGCASCEMVLRDTLPLLQARYGPRMQVLMVPLNDLSEVDRLIASASDLKLQKDDIRVPLVMIGSQVLSGEEAVNNRLEKLIQDGLAAGGLPQPALPASLAELARRATPTPRATLPPYLQPPSAGVESNACSLTTPCGPTLTPAP